MEKEALSASQKVLITGKQLSTHNTLKADLLPKSLLLCLLLGTDLSNSRLKILPVRLLVSQQKGPHDGLCGALSSKMAKDTRSSPSPY